MPFWDKRSGSTRSLKVTSALTPLKAESEEQTTISHLQLLTIYVEGGSVGGYQLNKLSHGR